MTAQFAVHRHDDGGGVTRLAVHGEIDSDVSEAFSALVVDTVEQEDVTDLVIDLHHVTFLAAAGVRALLDGRNAAARRACPFSVVNAHGVVLKVLNAVRVIEILGVVPSPVQARR